MNPVILFLRQFFGYDGFFGLVALALAPVLLSVAINDYHSSRRLQDEGASAIAEVTAVRHTVTQRNRKPDSHTYTVDYRFFVNDRLFSESESVSEAFFNTVTQGESLPVVFWPQDPTVNELEPGSKSSDAGLELLGAFIFGAVGLFVVLPAWRKARHAVWMQRHAIRREVVVTGHVDTNVKVNKVRRWRATWRESDGRDGSTYMVKAERLPPIGSTITILADPAGSRASLWDGDL